MWEDTSRSLGHYFLGTYDEWLFKGIGGIKDMKDGYKTFTIEPMVNMGSDEIYTDEIDDWTVRTEDGLPSAQWEIMVLVTETGHEVLCW